ncbi:MAG: hypothetical protein QI223_08040 [Candidatus Korarchaeota archaeon]|nr:hypothetical protein [Candidatus Korarchaeota archaeon]
MIRGELARAVFRVWLAKRVERVLKGSEPPSSYLERALTSFQRLGGELQVKSLPLLLDALESHVELGIALGRYATQHKEEGLRKILEDMLLRLMEENKELRSMLKSYEWLLRTRLGEEDLTYVF